jgi:hypothetical protein
MREEADMAALAQVLKDYYLRYKTILKGQAEAQVRGEDVFPVAMADLEIQELDASLRKVRP